MPTILPKNKKSWPQIQELTAELIRPDIKTQAGKNTPIIRKIDTVGGDLFESIMMMITADINFDTTTDDEQTQRHSIKNKSKIK